MSGGAIQQEASTGQSTPAGNTALVRIERFEVTGNTLLAPELVDKALEPFKGNDRSYSDIQMALEALEGEYRKAGYSAVHVVTPEQEITGGVIRFQVIETVIGQVTIQGNKYYDKENIRSALPALIEGSTPSARKLSGNIQLANQNPTRQVDVVLALGKEDDTVDANVNIADSSPRKFYVTLDNTGSATTGMYRAGIFFQHNNLFNRDHAMTLSYVTSPDKHLRDVTQLTASYRLPLYGLGDSVDFIAARADTNAGSSPVVGGLTLTFHGKGNVYGVHYNHYLPRQGDYTSSITAGLDYKAYYNNCTLAGVTCSSVPDITLIPVTLSYSGTLTRPTRLLNYSASLSRNLPGGTRGGQSVFFAARNNGLAMGSGGIGAPADYTVARLNGSLAGALPQDWQYRLAANIQYTNQALLAYESMGLAGATSVRGFTEREVSNDRGYVLNLELYTPEMAPKLHMDDASLRFLGFVDYGNGSKVLLPGEAAFVGGVNLAQQVTSSVGGGFRYAYRKNVTAQFDLAKVTHAGESTTTKVGDYRGHISLMVSW